MEGKCRGNAGTMEGEEKKKGGTKEEHGDKMERNT